MTGQNDFLQFDEENKNILTQEQYKEDVDRLSGFKAGVARSNVKNKVLKQVSTMSAAIGQVIKKRGHVATDESIEILTESINNAFPISNVKKEIYINPEFTLNSDGKYEWVINHTLGTADLIAKIYSHPDNVLLWGEADEITATTVKYVVKAQVDTETNTSKSPIEARTRKVVLIG